MNQYREGKAKRTPVRGVKQNLKPYAYKQSELWLARVTAYLLYNGSATYFSVARLTVQGEP